MTTDAPRAQSVFANPHFRNLWIGGGVSALGDQFYLVALPWAGAATHRIESRGRHGTCARRFRAPC